MTERDATNKSKFILTLGTLASLIIVGGVLYQAQKIYLMTLNFSQYLNKSSKLSLSLQ